MLAPVARSRLVDGMLSPPPAVGATAAAVCLGTDSGYVPVMYPCICAAVSTRYPRCIHAGSTLDPRCMVRQLHILATRFPPECTTLT